MDQAQHGDLDGSFVWFFNEQRAQHFYFSEPLIDVRFMFFYRKQDDFTWENFDDLKGLSIGILPPTKLSKEFEQALQAKIFFIERVPTVESNLRKLLAGRIDLVVTDIEVGMDILNKKFTRQERNAITNHPKPVMAKPMYLLLSKKKSANRERVKKFNLGLRYLKSNGNFKRYIKASRTGEYLNN